MSVDDGVRREWTNLEQIPLAVKQTFIQEEDKNFYRHHGIDCMAVLRAFLQNIKTQKTVSGASTITMQLARIIEPRKNARATIFDKAKEALNAIRIEAKLSKDRILELYLNNLPFGFRTEGITSAARNFYAKDLYALTSAEIALLAKVPRRPNLYAKDLPSTNAFAYPNDAPHFVLWVQNQYKNTQSVIPQQLTLSIDNSLCKYIQTTIATLAEAHKEQRIWDGSALVLNSVTGEILAWCGSTDFYKAETGQIDGVLTKNQVGSSMKPFLYASALENGFAPTTVLQDVASTFGTTEIYIPENFNNRYNGPQLMRTCLASSLNIPAVYLLNALGMQTYLDVLDKLHFNSLQTQKESLGLSLALGSGEVSLLELVRAFTIFTRDGTIPVLRHTAVNYQVDGVMDAPILSTVYKKDTARIIRDMLQDKNARALGFGYSSTFDTPYPAIFKTGTSNQYQNIVALGATARYTVGVWMGSVTGETVVAETGSSLAASVVRAILDALEKESTCEEEILQKAFAEPEFYKKINVCTLSGMAPSPYCTNTTQEFVHNANSLQETSVCTWHYRKSDGTIGTHYPAEYQQWLSGKNHAGTITHEGNLRFSQPQDGNIFLYNNKLPSYQQQLRVDMIGGSDANGEVAELYVDGEFFATSKRPFVWYVPLSKGTHTLTGYLGSEETSITIQVR